MVKCRINLLAQRHEKEACWQAGEDKTLTST
jgi:hypothetical protein